MSFTIMTYNVHSCRGSDGRTSPQRIAEVIGGECPDVVALQELDVRLERSGLVDQAHTIAGELKMHCHFHPTLRVESGQYGNAVLSRYPLRQVRAAELPTFPTRKPLEKRGALAVETVVDGTGVRIINTHLGLNRKERLAQAGELLGTGWLDSADMSPPLVLCGDLNSTPLSAVYRSMARAMVDAQKGVPGSRPRATWPAWLPLARIDYVLVSPDVVVEDFHTVRTDLARKASDHLPLVVRLCIPEHEKDGGGKDGGP